MRFPLLKRHWIACCIVSGGLLLLSSQNSTFLAILRTRLFPSSVTETPPDAIAPTPNSISLTASHPTLNPDDIIGEWSEAGECDRLRRVYTHHGRFGVLRNQDGEWREVFADRRVGGTYRFVDQGLGNLPGTIELTDTVFPSGAFTIGIHELTTDTFRLELLADGDDPDFEPTGEVTTYVRCPIQVD
ncbi:MAG: hypothetical protein AAGD25_19135 [Cyanobacteria bacterium P01_F01_bin.150]